MYYYLLKLLILILVLINGAPIIVGLFYGMGFLKSEPADDSANRIKKMGRLMRGLAFSCILQIIIPILLILLFSRKNFIAPILDLWKGQAAYYDLAVLSMTALIAIFFGVIVSIWFKRKEGFGTGKSTGLFVVLIAASISVLGMYEGYLAENNLKIIKVYPKVSKHAVYADGNIYDLSNGSDKVSVVVLKNTGKLIINNTTVYLSDDENDPGQVVVCDWAVKPEDKLIVVMGSDNRIDLDEYGVGEVSLYDVNETLLDSFVFDDSLNKMSDRKEVKAPEFSHESGIYEDTIDLELSCKEGCRIYYTLDGSEPDENSMEYEGAIELTYRKKQESMLKKIHNISTHYLENHEEVDEMEPVDSGWVIRAVSVDDKGRKSEVITHSYFIGLGEYKDKALVSLVMDYNDLFGEHGIYVTGNEYAKWYEAAFKAAGGAEVSIDGAPQPNYENKGVGSERRANVEILTFEDGECLNSLNQEVGVKIQGASTRGDVYKRFSIFSRKDYSGSKWFEAPIFEEDKDDHSFVIRHGFDNAFTPLLVKDRDLAVLDSIPVNVFINGEFFLETFVQEKYSEELISKKYGISEDNVDILKFGLLDEFTDSQKEIYDDIMVHYANDVDLADPEVYEEFCDKVDIQSYIDFVCANIYLGNEDVNDHKNYAMFRAKEAEGDGFKDGRIHFGLYDMDLLRNSVRFEKGYEYTYMIDTFRDEPPFGDDPFVEKPLFKALFRNEDFRNQFYNTFVDMANNDFSIENVSRVMEEFGSEDTVETYDEGFFMHRREYIMKYLEEVMSEYNS